MCDGVCVCVGELREYYLCHYLILLSDRRLYKIIRCSVNGSSVTEPAARPPGGFKNLSSQVETMVQRQLCGEKCVVDVRGQRSELAALLDTWKGSSGSNNHLLQPTCPSPSFLHHLGSLRVRWSLFLLAQGPLVQGDAHFLAVSHRDK